MRMRAAHRAISDIKMVVHQQYEWITEREVLWRDDWRCQVPWPYEPRGQFRNAVNAADTALVQHPHLLSRTPNVVCLCTIWCPGATITLYSERDFWQTIKPSRIGRPR